MAKGLTNIKKANQSGWGARITVQNRISASPEIHTISRMMALVRALLIEVPEANAHYHKILLPTAMEVIDRAGGLPILPEKIGQKKQDRIVSDLTERMNATITEPERQLIWDFVDLFLLGSPLLLACLGVRLAMDSLGIDPVELETARQANAPIWMLKYGKQTTREGQRRQSLLGSRVKGLKWTQLDDDAIMERATMWVRAHIVWGSLRKAVLEYYGEDQGGASQGKEDAPENVNPRTGKPHVMVDLISWWDRQLKPFDDDIGRERQRGKRYT